MISGLPLSWTTLNVVAVTGMPSSDSAHVEPPSIERKMPLVDAAQTTGPMLAKFHTVVPAGMPLSARGGFHVWPLSVLVYTPSEYEPASSLPLTEATVSTALLSLVGF